MHHFENGRIYFLGKDVTMNEQKVLVAIASIALMMAASCYAAPNDDVQAVRSAVSLPPGCVGLASTDICVCTDANLGGTCGALSSFTRFYMNLSTSSGNTAFNDTITSIKTGSQARGKICADPGGAGNCGYLDPSTTYADLGSGIGCAGHTCTSGTDFHWGCKCMNNTVTSIRVDPDSDNCASLAQYDAAIFEDPNYNSGMTKPSGTSRDCVVLHGDGTHGLHGYPNPFLNSTDGETGGGFGLNTDVISSVRLGSSAELALWADGNFTGTIAALYVSTPSLSSSINDKTSSIDFFDTIINQ
jgi:hypothetical protein